MVNGIGFIGILLLTVGAGVVLGIRHRQGMLAKLRHLLCGAVCLGVGALCVGLMLAVRSFEAFVKSTVVAEVRCQWVGPKTFDVTLVQVRAGVRQRPETFRLKGDQWAVSGGVVKWHPWLTALGIPSYHKLTRLSGRYATTSDEQANQPTAFDLNGGFDRYWLWFYQFDPWLPFVQATYGSSAFAYVNPTLRFEVYVTPSGYLIEHKRPASKPSQDSEEPYSGLQLPAQGLPRL